MRIFLDTADLKLIEQYRFKVDGFTTNPSFMKEAGATNYQIHARKVLRLVPKKPVSFEALTEEPKTMLAEAKKLASWGKNVVVKIPIIDSAGKTWPQTIAKELVGKGISINLTAIFTRPQVKAAIEIGRVARGQQFYISIFAGRLANAGLDPIPTMKYAVRLARKATIASRRGPAKGGKIEILWAAAREPYNIYEAQKIGCDIITVGPKVLADYLKYNSWTAEQYSRWTVKTFGEDAQSAGLKL